MYTAENNKRKRDPASRGKRQGLTPKVSDFHTCTSAYTLPPQIRKHTQVHTQRCKISWPFIKQDLKRKDVMAVVTSVIFPKVNAIHNPHFADKKTEGKEIK